MGLNQLVQAADADVAALKPELQFRSQLAQLGQADLLGLAALQHQRLLDQSQHPELKRLCPVAPAPGTAASAQIVPQQRRVIGDGPEALLAAPLQDIVQEGAGSGALGEAMVVVR